ncbi:MAG: Glycine cleavage system H protein [uncultured bacterium]|nr:MAG: Glycine cleavage system H protein [uncultured bacterium]
MEFSLTHEWVNLENGIATIGITNFGRMHLGEIVNIQLPDIGKVVKSGEEVGILESNKAAVDFHSPISGKIVEINDKLNQELDSLNKSPEDEGWLFKVKADNPKELESLMSLDEYEKKLTK